MWTGGIISSGEEAYEDDPFVAHERGASGGFYGDCGDHFDNWEAGEYCRKHGGQ